MELFFFITILLPSPSAPFTLMQMDTKRKIMISFFCDTECLLHCDFLLIYNEASGGKILNIHESYEKLKDFEASYSCF